MFRGQSVSSKDLIDGANDRRLSMSPLSSWSFDLDIAKAFSNHESWRGDTGNSAKITLTSQTPASRVFGMFGSGFGCLGEQELVLLGGSLEYDNVSGEADVNNSETMVDIFKRYEIIDDVRRYLKSLIEDKSGQKDARLMSFFQTVLPELDGVDVAVSTTDQVMEKFIRDLLNSGQDLPDDLVDLIKDTLAKLNTARQDQKIDGVRKIGYLVERELEDMEMKKYQEEIQKEIKDWEDEND